MKIIYVVMGTTGEYSDRNEWAVMAFFDKSLAQDHVLKADRRAKELFATRKTLKKVQNEFDPEMQMDYTGTSYFIYEVPIAEEST